jgi:ABC-2 type transport system ATP-binding protein
MPPILEATNLEKHYGDIRAVNGVSFSIEAGEIFSLLGPNGAGKTTTISMLSTLIAPTHGDASIGGYSIRKRSLEVRNLIGVIPQEIALYDTLTAMENLVFWGRLYGLSGSHLYNRAVKILEQIGLADRAKHRVETFSGGMKRRLNIGVGLLHQPHILFMDEPTVGIDPQSRRNILEMVKALNQDGMSVLYTTHYMEEAQEISNRVGILDHGQMIAIGTQKELTRMVGENQTLRLHTIDYLDGVEYAVRLESLPDITHAATVGDQIVLVTPDAGQALPMVIGCANEMGLKIRSIDIEEPNLESVFLHLTGRALRD